MYTKYDNDIANAYKKIFSTGRKGVVSEADEDLENTEMDPAADTGTDDVDLGAGEEVEEDPLDIAIAEYEAAAEAALEQEDEEGAAKNTQLADWLKELKEFKAAAEGEGAAGEELPEEIEEGTDEPTPGIKVVARPTASKPGWDKKDVTESTCCKKAKVTTVAPNGKKVK